MVGISRSFNSTEYHEGMPPSEFPGSEPIARHSTVIRVNRDKNRLLIASHRYPQDQQPYSSRMWSFDITFENWEDISDLVSILRKYRNLPDDVRLSKEIPAEEIEAREIKHNQDGQSDFESENQIFESVAISVSISPSQIEFAKRPEGGMILFPSIPCGDAFSLEGGSSNMVNLARFIELLEKVEQGFDSESTIHPTLLPENQQTLSKYKYGNEIIEHTQDGDICLENDLHHLGLSSYIHAIEWTSIAYLENKGIDIIEAEKEGNYYNFAGGRNNILDELKNNSDLDQKTISQLGSMNRAERRWMAHHKSGEILPEEVEAIRARLSTLIDSLLLNTG